MAKQWKLTFTDLTPNFMPDRSTLEVVDIGIQFAVNEISIYIGDSVSEYRQNEIVNGWKWLVDGIRERSLLVAPPFRGAALITGASIDSLTEQNRRTSSDVGDFNADDVMVGIGANVTALGDTMVIDNAFRLLSQFAVETTLDLA